MAAPAKAGPNACDARAGSVGPTNDHYVVPILAGIYKGGRNPEASVNYQPFFNCST